LKLFRTGTLMFAGFTAVLTFVAGAGPIEAASLHTSNTAPAPRIRLTPSNSRGAPVAGPGYFRLTARPGTTVALYASLGNEDSLAGSVQIVPVDAQSAVYGGISYDLPQQKRSAVGSWIQPAESSVIVAPHHSVVVPILLHIPLHVSPGVHVGGITAYVPTTPSQATGFGSLQVQLRVVVAVVVRIPGRLRKDVSIRGINIARRPTGSYVLAHIRNTGNTLAKGTLRLRIRGPMGHQVLTRRVGG
jgi:hypothetical protein